MTHLTELLDFRPDQGIIRLHEQRVVILSVAAMGLLRKELIDTLGVETGRRIFLRFGFADGYHDAVSLRDRSKWATPLEGLRAGIELQRLEGIVRADILRLEHEPASGRFQEDLEWHESYVAEQHVHHHGTSDSPMCWSLVGYASGYAIQAKLLRALQEREIRRVGAERTIKVSARVVAATNRDLRAAVEAGTFREDLYFRLEAFVITVPPLRERREDIPALVNDFVRRAATRVKRAVNTVSADAMTALMRYRWPGNVRELEHAIESAVIVARGSAIRLRELPPEIWQKNQLEPTGVTLDLRVNERDMIERALRRFHGSRREAAEALKISTVTLWRKIKNHGIDV